MSEGKKRRVHTAEFKGKVGLEAVRGVKTVTEIAQEYGVHPVLVGQWKKEILDNAAALFEAKRGPSRSMKAARKTSCMARSGGSRCRSIGLKKS
jgi:transposase-like protein